MDPAPDVPEVRITNGKVLLDGAVVDEVTRPGHGVGPDRMDGLFDALKRDRDAWKAAHPHGGEDEAVVQLYLDENLPIVVVKSVFQTAAVAGYPMESFLVRPTGAPDRLARINCDALVPELADAEGLTLLAPEPRLLLDVGSDRDVSISWITGTTVVRSGKRESIRRGPPGPLADAIVHEWTALGSHRNAKDRRFDQAVLRVSDDLPLRALIEIMDAAYAPKRDFALPNKVESVPAFNVTFAILPPKSPISALYGRGAVSPDSMDAR